MELQHIMEEMGKMFGGRRRGTEWSIPWPYKGASSVHWRLLFKRYIERIVLQVNTGNTNRIRRDEKKHFNELN